MAKQVKTAGKTAFEKNCIDGEKVACCLCGAVIPPRRGNNPEPLASSDERCCDQCNATKVIPARFVVGDAIEAGYSNEQSEKIAKRTIAARDFDRPGQVTIDGKPFVEDWDITRTIVMLPHESTAMLDHYAASFCDGERARAFAELLLAAAGKLDGNGELATAVMTGDAAKLPELVEVFPSRVGEFMRSTKDERKAFPVVVTISKECYNIFMEYTGKGDKDESAGRVVTEGIKRITSLVADFAKRLKGKGTK